MPPRPSKKRLGKKHRQASTRPKKGAPAPRNRPTTGAQLAGVGNASPKGRKVLAAARRKAEAKRHLPTQSPERQRGKPIAPEHQGKPTPTGLPSTKSRAAALHDPYDPELEVPTEAAAWSRAESLAAQMPVKGPSNPEPRTSNLPLIAICGRPNVGKSTLFNRLTGSRRSIVGDEPGITRDRIYSQLEWLNREARIVDTGGVLPDDPELIPAEIFRQAQAALAEADAIIMVVDGRTELAAPDLELSRLLLRSGKPVFLAVNKIDTGALIPLVEDFRRLGFANIVPVSAEHGSGIGDLLDDVFSTLPEPDQVVVAPEATLTETDEMEEDATGPDFSEPPGAELTPVHPRHAEHIPDETPIAIIGRPNVGKSTLLNALTGSSRAIVSPIAGTTRDAVDELVVRNGQALRFIDTAGIRRKGKTRLMAEKLSVVMARRHLESADIALLVLDATAGVTALDATIGGYAHESGRSVIIVVNKWDLVSRPADGSHPPASQKIFEEQLRDRLKFLDYAPVVFLSAASGTGLDGLYRAISRVARERRKRITTGQMNRFLAHIDFQQAPVPLKRRVKIYYMTQAAVAPPTFVLFTDRDVPLHFAFERFLANRIRESFGFAGTPIRFHSRPRNKRSKD
ncbi:MAG TPA: ribosome biogenesis GTPase Der [Acidobacteriaceae bacterium]|nr:ribosome biogenesis GTPase Der [Acidobacteriaceae bacterium]